MASNVIWSVFKVQTFVKEAACMIVKQGVSAFSFGALIGSDK